MSDSKSPQASWTLLSILAVLNNVVVWMVSTLPPTSKSSSPFNIPLVTVPNAPITIGIIVTFIFHSFFNSLARSKYLSFFLLSFSFILWSTRTAKSTILQVLYCYYYYCEFFISILNDGLSLGSEWQQFFLDFLDSFEFSSSAAVCIFLILLRFSNSLSLFTSPDGRFQMHQLKLVSSTPSCLRTFTTLWQDSSICMFSFSFIFTLWSAGAAKSIWLHVLSFLLLNTRSGLIDGIGWSVWLWLGR